MLQNANRIDAFPDQPDVHRPEQHETDKLDQADSHPFRHHGRTIGNEGKKYQHDGVNGSPANPGLDTKPATGNDGAKQRGDMRAANTE